MRVVNPNIVEWPSLVLVGKMERVKAESGQIASLWDRWHWVLAAMRTEERGVMYGATGQFDPATNTFEYLAAVSVAPTARTPDGFQRWDLPMQTYAICECTLGSLANSVHVLKKEWLPSSGYKRGAGPELERYGSDYYQPHHPLTVWLPIRPIDSDASMEAE